MIYACEFHDVTLDDEIDIVVEPVRAVVGASAPEHWREPPGDDSLDVLIAFDGRDAGIDHMQFPQLEADIFRNAYTL